MDWPILNQFNIKENGRTNRGPNIKKQRKYKRRRTNFRTKVEEDTQESEDPALLMRR